MKTITKKLPEYKKLKYIFENFQSEFIDSVLKCHEQISDKISFGVIVDLLSGLRAETQLICDECACNELIEEMFADVPQDLNEGETKHGKNRLRK